MCLPWCSILHIHVHASVRWAHWPGGKETISGCVAVRAAPGAPLVGVIVTPSRGVHDGTRPTAGNIPRHMVRSTAWETRVMEHRTGLGGGRTDRRAAAAGVEGRGGERGGEREGEREGRWP